MSCEAFDYEIATGALLERDERGNMVELGRGYSGFGIAKNDPAKVWIRGAGPIPPGRWVICSPFTDVHTGPLTMRLWPCPGTPTLGRSAFMIHGDSVRDPGHASHGCIVMPLEVRQRIADRVRSDPDVVVLTVR